MVRYMQQMKLMEATVIGALRREEVANTAIQTLEFEIEHVKRLVRLTLILITLILIRKMSFIERSYDMICRSILVMTSMQAFQQEEDGQRTKMLLKFREEKIRQLELFLGGRLSADQYLLEENKALVIENKMLQAKINRNPELTRVSLENSKLIEQLQV